jgi:hypothetical protein
MVIRNRLASLLYRALEVAIAIYTLVAVYSSPLKDAQPLRYFSVETAIYVTVIVILAFIFNLIDLIRHGFNGVAAYVYMPLTLAAVVYLLGEGLSYWILYPTIYGSPWGTGMAVADLFSHLILPLVIFLGWLLFDAKGTVKWRHGIYFLAFPLFYILYSELAQTIFQDTFYAYDTMNPNFYANLGSFMSSNGGWTGVTIFMFSMMAFMAALSFFMIFLNNLLAGKYRRIRD